jgi:digeranylgeranylglycerophospholipid reductase
LGGAPEGVGPAERARERSFRDAAKAEDRQVVVVGAGPAGATAARHARLAGARDVVLIDRRARVGTPVECAGFLPAEDELAAMLPSVQDQRGLFHVPDEFVLARTEETAIVSPGGRVKVLPFRGITIDRAAWDMRNVELAVEAGVEFRPSTSAEGLEGGVLRTDRGAMLASVIVAADGPHSRVRGWAGLPEPRLVAPAINAVARIEHGGRVEMHFGREAPGGYAWVIPAGDGVAHVGLGVDPRFGGRELKTLLERFARRVGADIVELAAGFVPSAGPLARTHAGNVMVVGDAAGHVMASNGGGIPIALAAGRVAGRVAARVATGEGTIEEYEAGWRAEVGDVLRVSSRTRWMAGLPMRSPALLSMAMWAMPRWEMARALRCQRLLFFY